MLDSPLDEQGRLRGVLLSIHMTSNRPRGFATFLDRLEETTRDPARVEVVIKIDDGDAAMNALLAEEKARRPFRITYISTPLVGGFYGLWRSYDELLRICDPHAYFVVGLNDEMFFVEKDWDERLIRYVNLYPDHIYRLRTSIHRERNCYDYWEAACAGDLSPIMTKRWLELGGGWCPCSGPDNFQNSVAFYFGWLYRHDTFGRPYRERIVHDIEFGAYGANNGLTDPVALRRRMRGALIAWYRLMSYPMQQDAARRAQILHAHIWAHQHGIAYEIKDLPGALALQVIEKNSGLPVWQASYKLSRLRITATNLFRALNYPYYGGAGELYREMKWENLLYYFLLRYEGFERFYTTYSRRREALWQCILPLGRFVKKILCRIRQSLRAGATGLWHAVATLARLFFSVLPFVARGLLVLARRLVLLGRSLMRLCITPVRRMKGAVLCRLARGPPLLFADNSNVARKRADS